MEIEAIKSNLDIESIFPKAGQQSDGILRFKTFDL